VPDQTPKAVHAKPPWFAPLLNLLDTATDPANLALIPVFCACVAIVAADVNTRLAVVLTAAALTLIATRVRHATTLAVLMLCAFAAVALMHVPQITTPRSPTSTAADGRR
jgi:hypothetical protein